MDSEDRFSAWTDFQSSAEQINKSRSIRIFAHDWFKSPKDFKFIDLNNFISSNQLQIMMDYILQTDLFAIETSSNKPDRNGDIYHTIFIDLLNPKHLTSLSIYLCTDVLFVANNPSLPGIRTILNSIFQLSKQFYSWNLNREHLQFLVTLGYLTQIELDQIRIMDVQIEYVHWLRKMCRHQSGCPCFRKKQVAHRSCTCSRSPSKDRSTPWTVPQAFNLHMRTSFYLPSSVGFGTYIEQVNVLKSGSFRFHTLLMITILNLTFEEIIDYRQRFQGNLQLRS
jgi:hypothetical protein